MNKEMDYLNSILDFEKNLSNYYSEFLNEASNDYLYENVFSMLEDSKDMIREIYNFMYSKKCFTLVDEKSDKIEKEVIILKNLLEK